jgi:hypothetical protein
LFDTVSEKSGKITKEYNLVSPPLGKGWYPYILPLGAYGEVRKAIHKSSGQVRAVKIISKQHTSQVEQERLKNEVEILKRLVSFHQNYSLPRTTRISSKCTSSSRMRSSSTSLRNCASAASCSTKSRRRNPSPKRRLQAS